MPLLESDIQRTILDYLRMKGIFCWKQQTAGIRKPDGSYIPSHTRGVSDILGVLSSGRFLAIEVKRPGNKPTPEQVYFMENVGQAGGLAFVAYSVEDVIRRVESQKPKKMREGETYKLNMKPLLNPDSERMPEPRIL